MEFSVIVPVYRVEKYLAACVDSILSQTFSDFELILVDDGSPDGCPAICDGYAQKDRRVRVLHKKNGGVVSARKAGLMAASGEYVVFMDGDDWAALNFLERGHALIEKYQADMFCFARSNEYKTHSEIQYEPVREGLYKRERIQERLYPMLLMDVQMQHLMYFVFKIIRRSLANQSFMQIRETQTLGEDMLCVILAYLKARSVYIGREVMGFYRIREGSASHSFKLEQYRQIDMAMAELKNIGQSNREKPVDFEQQMMRYGAYMYFVLLVRASQAGKPVPVREIRHQTSPVLGRCIKEARFHKISTKTKITFFLLKKGRIEPAYLFLRACERLKTIWRERKGMSWSH